MAVRVLLLVTLFCGLSVADLTEMDFSTCSCGQIGNLALGAPAVQSSTYEDLGPAHNAVDGDTQSNYRMGSCTHTNDNDPWWRVDLRETYNISGVIITNRGDCCGENISGAQIRIGNSLENNGNNNPVAATILSISQGATATFAFQPMKGRYVNIYLPRKNTYLTLCEVQVFTEIETPGCTCVPKNLALGAPAVQSSTYDDLGYAPNAVDGNTESDYWRGSCTHTNDNDPWWRVDLRSTYSISRVVISNRGDCCGERISGAQIRIGNSLENNGNNNPVAVTISNIPAAATETFRFSPIRGQFVSIFLPGKSKYLTLCEVQVFAD